MSWHQIHAIKVATEVALYMSIEEIRETTLKNKHCPELCLLIIKWVTKYQKETRVHEALTACTEMNQS